MQQTFTVENRSVPVVWEQLTPPFRLRVGEETVVVRHHRPGLMILEDGRCLRYVSAAGNDPTAVQVDLQGQRLSVALVRAHRGPGGAAQGGVVKSPMNGVVSKVEVSPGQVVEAGQVVLVLEAMKMENEVTAPIAGALQSLSVTQGQVVSAAQLLFEIRAGEV